MKKIIYILIASAVIVLNGTSCDVLDRYPHNAVSRDNLSVEDLELLFTGLYCYSQYKPTFTGYFQNDNGLLLVACLVCFLIASKTTTPALLTHPPPQ